MGQEEWFPICYRSDPEKLVKRIMAEQDKLEQIKTELEIYHNAMKHIGGCTDGNCLIMRPVGMHTNGGCRCYDRPTMEIRRVLMYASILYTRISKITKE